MRTIVNIPESQLKILNKLAAERKISRSELIRQALAEYSENRKKELFQYKSAFGSWKKKNLDSIDYQKKIREEWL